MHDDDQQQADIDAVPILSLLQATRTPEGDALWNRAIAYEHALQDDPDWQDKPQRDIYAEVGRRLEEHMGPAAVRDWLELEDEQPAGLDLATATPEEIEAALDEHGDVDGFIERLAGPAPGGSDLENVDVHEIEAQLEAAGDIDAFLARALGE